jgi:hypothetical protein
MNRLLAAIVASTMVLGSASGFAAEAAKKEELTQEQRMDMRNRADQLVKERAAGTSQVKTNAQPSPKAKAHNSKKSTSRHNAKKTEPKS